MPSLLELEELVCEQPSVLLKLALTPPVYRSSSLPDRIRWPPKVVSMPRLESTLES
jgi:hypothetical protein